MLHVGGSGSAQIFNALALTTNSIAARADVSELAVVREERKIEAEVESIMKVGGVGSQVEQGGVTDGVLRKQTIRAKVDMSARGGGGGTLEAITPVLSTTHPCLCVPLSIYAFLRVRASLHPFTKHQGGYDHYMQKEIQEQPKSLTDTMRGRVVLGKPLKPLASGAANIIVSGHHLDASSAVLAAAEAAGGGAGGFAISAVGGLQQRVVGCAADGTRGYRGPLNHLLRLKERCVLRVSRDVRPPPSLPCLASSHSVCFNPQPPQFAGRRAAKNPATGLSGAAAAAKPPAALPPKAGISSSPGQLNGDGEAAEAEPYVRRGGLTDYVEGILRCRGHALRHMLVISHGRACVCAGASKQRRALWLHDDVVQHLPVYVEAVAAV